MNLGRREDILGRIREALRVLAPHPHDGHDSAPAPSGRAQPQVWLPAVPPDAEGQLALFQKTVLN